MENNKNLEEKIIELLESEKIALSPFELEQKLNLNKNEFVELIKTLNEMEQNLKIYKTKKDNYMIFENSHLKIGKIEVNPKGFGFVDIGKDKDIFIPKDAINKAIHGDTVIVEITSKNDMDPEGRIVKIVDRKLDNMVGEFYYHKGKPYVDLDNKKVKIKIEIDSKATKGAMNGHKVIVKITNKISSDNYYKGEVLKI